MSIREGSIVNRALLETLSEREMALLYELLRIESELQGFGALATEGERVMHELLLSQLELVIDRLSPEDEELWGHVWRIVDWLRFEALHRGGDEYSFEALVSRAEVLKGAPLSEEEYRHFRELAQEIAEVDRELSADN